MEKTATKQLTYLSNLATLLDLFREGTITEKEMSHLWSLAQKFVSKVAQSHYKRTQSKGYRYEVGYCKNIYSDPTKYQVTNDYAYEKHQARLLMFIDFVLDNKHKTTKWCLSAWRIRKSWVELLVEAKVYGVKLYPDDLSITKQINKQLTRKLVEAKSLLRTNNKHYTDVESLRELYLEKHPNKPEESVNKFVVYYRMYLQALSPNTYEPRDTNSKSKRDIEIWRLRRIVSCQ